MILPNTFNHIGASPMSRAWLETETGSAIELCYNRKSLEYEWDGQMIREMLPGVEYHGPNGPVCMVACESGIENIIRDDGYRLLVRSASDYYEGASWVCLAEYKHSDAGNAIGIMQAIWKSLTTAQWIVF